MEIIIAATKNCPHRPLLEKILQDAWLPYKVFYFENHPELIKKFKIKHSPLLIVDEKVESLGMPEMEQITELISRIRDISEIRVQKRAKNHMIPININKEPDLVEVDTTWGSIQPMQSAKAVLTVGELEVFHHKIMNLPIIDARKPDTFDEVSIPGSKNISHDTIVEKMSELDENQPSIFFCNGPQCPQSSTAIKNLIEVGYPADKILYYRGGMHDWITLGFPVKRF